MRERDAIPSTPALIREQTDAKQIGLSAEGGDISDGGDEE